MGRGGQALSAPNAVAPPLRQRLSRISAPPLRLRFGAEGIDAFTQLMVRDDSETGTAKEAVISLNKELASAGAACIGKGGQRRVYQVGDTVYKVPLPYQPGVNKALHAQWHEAVAAELGYREPYVGLPMAETQLFYHHSGLPIIAMEHVDTTALEVDPPGWWLPRDGVNRSEKLRFNYDTELLNQIGKNASGDWVLYDLSEVPFNRSKEEWERHPLFWPRNWPPSRLRPSL